MLEKYSVLMAVYFKENPAYLKTSMESMFWQTIPPDDFVLVCDGPLNEELNNVIAQMKLEYKDILHVIRLSKNNGLGCALNEGLKCCKHELVARMDSDDISRLDRCERQLLTFDIEPELDIVSGTVEEFAEFPEKVLRKRELPITYEEICKFSKKRNPFNHPAVMFKKAAVMKAGNYNETYRLFEDYYLWIRMLLNRCRAKNICSPLLYMRVSEDLYQRRGGKQYAKDMLRFHRWMQKVGWTNWLDYLTGAVPHAWICVAPQRIRKWIYNFLRN